MVPPPGAGGAGGGAAGPGAIGGDGGGGGDYHRGSLDVAPGDVVEFNVGDGGKPGRLPGQHPTRGSDTVVAVKSAGGAIKHVVRAQGGAAAMSGTLPTDWLPISQADISDGFQISSLFAANSVEFHDGLVFVLGGGWLKFIAPTLPFDGIWQVVCVATWPKLSAGHTRGLQLCLSDPNGEEVSRIALEIPATAADEIGWTWVRGLGAPLNQEGPWRVSIKSGEFLLSEIYIAVTV